MFYAKGVGKLGRSKRDLEPSRKNLVLPKTGKQRLIKSKIDTQPLPPLLVRCGRRAVC